MIEDAYCDHRWMREDMTTKQCVRCGEYRAVDGDSNQDNKG